MSDELAEPEFNLDKIAFEQQRKFINDPSRLKALFCTRRSAKSYTGGIYLVHEALKHPRANCLYIALTKETAKGIVWKDILKEINVNHKLNIQFNSTTLVATFPNGSEIVVTGADANEDEMNKLLGKKYRLVVIDEASMFSVNMHQLVYGILKPATADQKGTICLLGTASNITRGLFYNITTGYEAGWSLHRWTAFDNPHVAKQWQEEIDDIKTNRPDFLKTALYKQWFLNEWVIDENALIYKFDRKRNNIDFLPIFAGAWHNSLGIFIGESPEPSAFVVARYNDESPRLFIVYSEKNPMDAKGVSEKIKQLDTLYTFETIVIYGLTKMAVNEFNTRYECGAIAADNGEKEKEDWIKLLNSDFNQGQCLLTTQTEELKQELETNVWETDNGKIIAPKKEHGGIPNQLSNAFLYLWRHTYPYLYTKKDVGIVKIEDWEKKHIQNLSDQIRRAQNPQHFDADFAPDEDLFDFDKDDIL